VKFGTLLKFRFWIYPYFISMSDPIPC